MILVVDGLKYASVMSYTRALIHYYSVKMDTDSSHLKMTLFNCHGTKCMNYTIYISLLLHFVKSVIKLFFNKLGNLNPMGVTVLIK